MCTPNMHLHCHLKQCPLDYGPACSFWLFACERMNEHLGSLPTNHHSIEVQLMWKFTCTQQVLQLFSLSDDTHLQDLLKNFQLSKDSLNYEDFPDLPVLSLSLANAEFINTLHTSLYPIKEACLCSAELEIIDTTLKSYFGSAYVWTLMLQSSRFPDAYIPITDVLCRCAHVTETVNFNAVFDTVTIIVPINHFCGL